MLKDVQEHEHWGENSPKREAPSLCTRDHCYVWRGARPQTLTFMIIAK